MGPKGRFGKVPGPIIEDLIALSDGDMRNVHWMLRALAERAARLGYALNQVQSSKPLDERINGVMLDALIDVYDSFKEQQPDYAPTKLPVDVYVEGELYGPQGYIGRRRLKMTLRPDGNVVHKLEDL